MLYPVNFVRLRSNTFVNPVSLLVIKIIELEKDFFFHFPKYASKNELVNEIIPWELAGAGYTCLPERSFGRMVESLFLLKKEESWRECPVSGVSCSPPTPVNVQLLLSFPTRSTLTSAHWVGRTHCSTFGLSARHTTCSHRNTEYFPPV